MSARPVDLSEMTVSQAQRLVLERGRKPRFGDMELIRAMEITALVRDWFELAGRHPAECDECEGTGEIECSECGQERECKKCAGTGETRPVLCNDPERLKGDIERWRQTENA